MMFCTVHSLGELTVRFPVSGAFSTYFTRFIDPAWGFAMGWNYVLGWACSYTVELVAASFCIGYWKDTSAAANTNPLVWVTVFWIVTAGINLFGVRGFGEAEFVFSLVKVIAIVGFIILGIVLVCGGGPNHVYIGAQYWHDPGAFNAGFKGLCSVFVNAAFAFSGTELVGLAAAETANPRVNLPKATKQVFWRITLFYIVSLILVGFLVPYTDLNLLGASSVDIAASPFVIAIKNAGISGLSSVMNCVVLVSVLSVGNSSVYASSRTIAALSAQGLAPKWMGYIDRQGRPLAGIIITCLFGLIAFCASASVQVEIFDWLLALSGLSSLFIWASICFCHIQFRRALKYQGRTTEELEFKSAVGLPGSIYGFVLNSLVLIAQFWTALFPIGTPPNASAFFQIYMTFPIIVVCYIAYKLWYRPKWVRIRNMDIDTGRREVDVDQLREEIKEEKAYIASRGWWYRAYRFWC
jgi:amino acid transporter